MGHSNPGGSSSGSAAGVAAGFAPISLGTETDGSITQPAGRASLYAIKATPGLIDVTGVSPFSKFCDSLGPMAKCTEDVADLLGVLMDRDFSKDVVQSFSKQKIAFVDPDVWEMGAIATDRHEMLLSKQVCANIHDGIAASANLHREQISRRQCPASNGQELD